MNTQQGFIKDEHAKNYMDKNKDLEKKRGP
jgi:hypothetical protein